MDWKEIKRVLRADGKQRLLIMAASGSFFRFEEDTYVTKDGYTFWRPTHSSGLYDSAEAAERDARIELPWLRDNPENRELQVLTKIDPRVRPRTAAALTAHVPAATLN
jgi:hypothetical protein